MAHCHCTMCRKFHGAAHSTYGEAKPENFRWTRGEDRLVTYAAPNGTTRRFCGTCGSSMTFAPATDTGDAVEFSLGTLDSEVDERPDAHVFMDFKANWSVENDELPQFSGDRNSIPFAG